MGQRLVITANYKDQEIAKIYFHWSAYTVSALQEAYDLISAININDSNIKQSAFRGFFIFLLCHTQSADSIGHS